MNNVFESARHSARLSRAECADYLRVNISTVNRWNNGSTVAPFAVLELLRCVGGFIPAVSVCDRHDFIGFCYSGNKLVTDNGDMYTAGDIRSIKINDALIRALSVEIRQLKATIDKLETPAPDNVLQFPVRRSVRTNA